MDEGLLVQKKHTIQAALVVINKPSRFRFGTFVIIEEDGENLCFKHTKGWFLFLQWLWGGEYKATCGQINYILDSLKQKRD